jgi:FlaA1/EpsC-like NDP-sugar epimerase
MIQNYLANNASRFASKWLVLLIDLITVGVSFVLSYLIRFNLTLNFDVGKLPLQLVYILFIATIAFLITGSYKGIVRHTGVRDVYNIFNAVCLFSIITILVVIVNRRYGILPDYTIPLGIIIINSLLAFIGLAASRFVFKYLYANLFTSSIGYVKNILIYGAGESGILTYNAISNHSKSSIQVVGFIDDDVRKIGKLINGIPVIAPSKLNEEFLRGKKIAEIIFSIHNIEQKKLRRIVEGMVEFPVRVKIVPPVEDWINGELKASQIKEVQIEDLLDRPPISLTNNRIRQDLVGKNILVTGGAGSIGSEIVRQICQYQYSSLVVLDQSESALYDLQQELRQKGYSNFVVIVGDVRDKNRCNAIFQEFKPDIIYHAAAYKHVPLMEYNSYEAIKVNVAGTKVIADLALEHKTDKFVLISTDKAVNPTNIMGATKRIAEIYVSCLNQDQRTNFITTRFGNVLGSNGSVIPLFKKQIEKGGPLTVTHREITRFFMTIPEASQLVLEAGAMGAGGEIFIFDMGESVKIFELAKNMIRLSGLRYPQDIDIKITGLRPGEKLYEELLANGENSLPTHHKKIMIGKVRDLNYLQARSKIEELCIANMFFKEDTVRMMKEIVPEFVSNNSEYCRLDIEKKSPNPERKSSINL